MKKEKNYIGSGKDDIYTYVDSMKTFVPIYLLCILEDVKEKPY